MQHLTISDERFWFRGIVAGEPAYVSTSDEEAEAAWKVPADLAAAAVLDAYRREIELADAVIAPLPSASHRPSGQSRSGRTGGCRTSAQSCCT